MRPSDLPRDIQPPEDLWPRIAARIRRRRALIALPPWALAAAAVTLMALSSAVTVYLLRSEPSVAALAPLPDHLMSLDRQYVGAAGEIERVIRSKEASLTPEAVATVERSLRIIDEAMREARTALARDPDNTALQQLFWATHEQKLDLLQRAVRLSEEL